MKKQNPETEKSSAFDVEKKLKAAKPRQLNPEIAKLRQEHAKRVAEFHRIQRSAAALETIKNRLIPLLTNEDLEIVVYSATQMIQAQSPSEAHVEAP